MGKKDTSQLRFGLTTSYRLLRYIVISLLQILVYYYHWGQIVGVLEGSVNFHQSYNQRYTNCELIKAQNPKVSANKIYTQSISHTRIPTHTSALHILLYSDTFFIRLALRRPRFCRISFLFKIVSLDLIALIAAIKHVTLISRDKKTYIESIKT